MYRELLEKQLAFVPEPNHTHFRERLLQFEAQFESFYERQDRRHRVSIRREIERFIKSVAEGDLPDRAI